MSVDHVPHPQQKQNWLGKSARKCRQLGCFIHTTMGSTAEIPWTLKSIHWNSHLLIIIYFNPHVNWLHNHHVINRPHCWLNPLFSRGIPCSTKPQPRCHWRRLRRRVSEMKKTHFLGKWTNSMGDVSSNCWITRWYRPFINNWEMLIYWDILLEIWWDSYGKSPMYRCHKQCWFPTQQAVKLPEGYVIPQGYFPPLRHRRELWWLQEI